MYYEILMNFVIYLSLTLGFPFFPLGTIDFNKIKFNTLPIVNNPIQFNDIQNFKFEDPLQKLMPSHLHLLWLKIDLSKASTMEDAERMMFYIQQFEKIIQHWRRQTSRMVYEKLKKHL